MMAPGMVAGEEPAHLLHAVPRVQLRHDMTVCLMVLRTNERQENFCVVRLCVVVVRYSCRQDALGDEIRQRNYFCGCIYSNESF